jgi:hypothetical protein
MFFLFIFNDFNSIFIIAKLTQTANKITPLHFGTAHQPPSPPRNARVSSRHAVRKPSPNILNAPATIGSITATNPLKTALINAGIAFFAPSADMATCARTSRIIRHNAPFSNAHMFNLLVIVRQERAMSSFLRHSTGEACSSVQAGIPRIIFNEGILRYAQNDILI